MLYKGPPLSPSPEWERTPKSEKAFLQISEATKDCSLLSTSDITFFTTEQTPALLEHRKATTPSLPLQSLLMIERIKSTVSFPNCCPLGIAPSICKTTPTPFSAINSLHHSGSFETNASTEIKAYKTLGSEISGVVESQRVFKYSTTVSETFVLLESLREIEASVGTKQRRSKAIFRSSEAQFGCFKMLNNKVGIEGSVKMPSSICGTVWLGVLIVRFSISNTYTKLSWSIKHCCTVFVMSCNCCW